MRILSRVFLLSVVVCSLSLTQQPSPPQQQQQQQQPPRERNKFILDLEKEIAGKDSLPAEQVFKNIEVFKGRPAGGMLRAMEFAFTPAMGTGCDHCHVIDKWDSDEKKPKATARKMFVMLSEVTKLLKQTVGERQNATCYMCHKGSPEPVKGLGRGPRPGGAPQNR